MTSSEEAVTLGHVLLTMHKINQSKAQIPTANRSEPRRLDAEMQSVVPGKEAVGAALTAQVALPPC